MPLLVTIVSAFLLGYRVAQLQGRWWRGQPPAPPARIAMPPAPAAPITQQAQPPKPALEAKPTPPKLAWLVAGASVIGRGHATGELPCQDSHVVRALGSGWGIAVVCDGAGSRKLSHQGASFAAQTACATFLKAIAHDQWQVRGQLPTEAAWRKRAVEGLQYVRDSMSKQAHQLDAGLDDLGCTIIVVIYSPLGLCAAHIGDGRAGYRDQQQCWHALMTPTKGEEANETYFITSADVWRQPDLLIESRVVATPPSAFVLLTDGCEQSAFKCGYFDEQQQRFIGQNEPHAEFFEPLIATLVRMHTDGLSAQAIDQRWEHFIAGGTRRLRDETDDKTLVLGIALESLV